MQMLQINVGKIRCLSSFVAGLAKDLFISVKVNCSPIQSSGFLVLDLSTFNLALLGK
jgi:hypothetical protein